MKHSPNSLMFCLLQVTCAALGFRAKHLHEVHLALHFVKEARECFVIQAMGVLTLMQWFPSQGK
jgi:hypothetical protein